MTTKESQVLGFIREHQLQTGGYPTYREIKERFNLKSPNSVSQYINQLAKEGHLTLLPRRGFRFSKNTTHVDPRLANAVMFAIKAHHTQVRDDGQPYITHPLAVMARMAPSITHMIVGVLHDVVEDTSYTLEDVAIACQLTEEEKLALDCISKRNGESNDEYYSRMRHSLLAMQVKYFGDIPHNLSTLLPWMEDRIPKYEALLDFLDTEIADAIRINSVRL